MAMRAPGEEFGEVESGHFRGALLDDEVVDGSEVGGGKAQFGEHQIDTVHPEGEFVFELGQVSLLEAGAVADDETALALMDVPIFIHPPAALTPPGMQVGIGHLRQAADGVVGVFEGLQNGGGEEGLFHGFEERRERKEFLHLSSFLDDLLRAQPGRRAAIHHQRLTRHEGGLLVVRKEVGRVKS